MACQRIDGSASRSHSMTGSFEGRACASLCVSVIRSSAGAPDETRSPPGRGWKSACAINGATTVPAQPTPSTNGLSRDRNYVDGSVPSDGSGDQLKPPNPLRPSRAIGTRRMTRVQQHAFRSGERHAQHHHRLPPICLPDTAGDRLGLNRSILSTEPMGCRVEGEREHSLLGLRTDVGATHLADGERRAVSDLAIHMTLERPRGSTRTGTET